MVKTWFFHNVFRQLLKSTYVYQTNFYLVQYFSKYKQFLLQSVFWSLSPIIAKEVKSGTLALYFTMS